MAEDGTDPNSKKDGGSGNSGAGDDQTPKTYSQEDVQSLIDTAVKEANEKAFNDAKAELGRIKNEEEKAKKEQAGTLVLAFYNSF